MATGPRSSSPFPLAGAQAQPGSATAPSSVAVLLVEDNPADARFFREALHLAGFKHTLTTVTNGEEALACLRGQSPFTEPLRPDVIVLDLKLPRVSGHAVLGAIRVDPELRSIPVMVLTSSYAARDQERSYDLRADYYVTKPVGLDVLAGELKVLPALAGRAGRS